MTNNSNERPKLTILIPTRNGAKTIGRAIESVIYQIETYSLANSIEILVANNGSSDGTEIIVQKFVTQFPFVSMINRFENLELDKNLNSAIDHIHTPWIKILADDDVLLNSYLVHLLNLIKNNLTADLIVSSMISMDDIDKSQELTNYENFKKYVQDPTFILDSNGYFGQLSTLCFRKASWVKAKSSLLLENYWHYGMEFIGRVYELILSGTCVYDDSRSMGNDLGPKRWNTSYLNVLKVKWAHFAFIYQMLELDLNKHANQSNWTNWIARTLKPIPRDCVFDLFRLRFANESISFQTMTTLAPKSIVQKRGFRLASFLVIKTPAVFFKLVIFVRRVVQKFFKFPQFVEMLCRISRRILK